MAAAPSLERRKEADRMKPVQKARELSEHLPALLVSAKRVASTVAMGLHGRKRAGPGDHFWEYRPYLGGEPAAHIDWRRSASQDGLYTKQREWEAPHTVWLWPDMTASMDYRSGLAKASKGERAVLLALAAGFLLADAGERIGLLGAMRAKIGQKAVERMAEALCFFENPPALPQGAPPKRLSEVVLLSDFLDPLEEIEAELSRLSAHGARGHLIQIRDPAEESFPFTGRLLFQEAEMRLNFLTGRAESYRDAYHERLSAHEQHLKELCRKIGWSFVVHHTNRPASEALLPLYTRLGA